MAIRAQSAVAHGEDPRAHARLLGRVRDVALTGGTPPTPPRPVIGDSWRRMQRLGLDPSGPQDVVPLDAAELQRRRASSGLEPLMPHLRAGLLPVAEAAGQVLVVVDPESRVLWREGSAGEHYADSHQPWTCAAAPLHDPVTGKLLGAVDLSGPAHTVHPSTVALVEAIARLSVLELKTAYDEQLSRLRSHAAPILARMPGRALAVALDGRVAAVTGLAAPARVALAEELTAGPAWLPAFGLCTAEPLPGGWLLRLLAAEPDAGDVSRFELDLSGSSGAAPFVRVIGPSGDWRHELSLRHAEILLSLAEHPAGRTAAQLAHDLFGDRGRTVTARAEISRLRRALGPLLLHQPYRLGSGVDVLLRLPEYPELVLPASAAPIVRAVRARMAG